MAYRVVQWGTGLVGARAAEGIIGHPGLELVGCMALTPGKVGRDVGELAGGAPIGVLATDRIADILALRPDCVVYMPLHWDVDAMVTLLEAGINVISTANFITGASYGAPAVARLQAAAVAGGASLYGSGINPGFANILALMSSAVCNRIDRISVLESVDSTGYASAETWTSLGFGEPPHTPGLADKARQRALVFLDAVEMMAAALKIELDDVMFRAEFGCATRDLALGYMDIAEGTVCGVKMTYSGVVAGRAVIEVGVMWRLGAHMAPDWVAREGYLVEIAGEPNVRCHWEVPGMDMAAAGFMTAMPVVHAIAAVCAAGPGIVTAAELPMIVAAHAVRPAPTTG